MLLDGIGAECRMKAELSSRSRQVAADQQFLADPVPTSVVPALPIVEVSEAQNLNPQLLQQDFQKSNADTSIDLGQSRKRTRDQSVHSGFKENSDESFPQPMNEQYSAPQPPRRIVELARSKAHMCQLADLARGTEFIQEADRPEENLGLVLFKRQRLEESSQGRSSAESSQHTQNLGL
ncbi:hypothetical protein R1sor_022656 [Riccia sorocarpa]|uniref:Uncharacterized protein n=1 Tax=Riccia sorocarpa TaxID=122646 RepID=A0ABD3GNN4_9MARC